MDGPEIPVNPECAGCQLLLKRIALLEASLAERDRTSEEQSRKIEEQSRRIEELTKKFEESQRSSKRQAAPFSKGKPKPDPKPPGRKPNDGGAHAYRSTPTPDQVDETLEANLPEACPHCQGEVIESESDLAEQFQTEIPRKPLIRKFRVHVGHCFGCGRRVQGRHPLQTSDALGAAASQIGPDAQAAASTLHTESGLAYGKVSRIFKTLFGIKLTRGACAQINLRVANRLEPDYQLILASVRRSEQIAADETGWRIGGRSAWLHVWVGDEATAFAIDSQRSAVVLERVIGRDWAGILSHDGFSSYDRFEKAIHQQCVAHVLRRARDLLSIARGGEVHFPKQVIQLFTEAVHWRNELLKTEPSLRLVRPLTETPLETQREAFDDRLCAMLDRPRTVPAYVTFAKHLWKHFNEWFTFVFDPRVEPTNWKGEQAIRPGVVNRKVWGGNRTEPGAKAQGINMSVFETCRRRALSVVDHVSQTLRAVGNALLTRPQLLLGR